MNEKHVFGLALGLTGTPWRVSDIRFDPEQRRLDIDLDFQPGSRFDHPTTGQPSPLHDTLQRNGVRRRGEKRWRIMHGGTSGRALRESFSRGVAGRFRAPNHSLGGRIIPLNRLDVAEVTKNRSRCLLLTTRPA